MAHDSPLLRVEEKPRGSFGATMNGIPPHGWITTRSNRSRLSPLPRPTVALDLTSPSTKRMRLAFSRRPLAHERFDPRSERTTRSATLDTNNYQDEMLNQSRRPTYH